MAGKRSSQVSGLEGSSHARKNEERACFRGPQKCFLFVSFSEKIPQRQLCGICIVLPQDCFSYQRFKFSLRLINVQSNQLSSVANFQVNRLAEVKIRSNTEVIKLAEGR